MEAINSGLVYVGHNPREGRCACACYGSAEVFRSVWDRLCHQLFEIAPPSMDTEDVLPDIDIWKGGVVLVEESEYPYTFTVMCENEEDTPKPSDVIQYKDKFYIIGEVVD